MSNLQQIQNDLSRWRNEEAAALRGHEINAREIYVLKQKEDDAMHANEKAKQAYHRAEIGSSKAFQDMGRVQQEMRRLESQYSQMEIVYNQSKNDLVKFENTVKQTEDTWRRLTEEMKRKQIDEATVQNKLREAKWQVGDLSNKLQRAEIQEKSSKQGSSRY